ncbi:MAG: hypothetical protein WD844_17690 [Thermoleophilaceae bacterium]
MRATFAILVLAALLALPSAAHAATVSRTGSVLTFVAHAGERNNVNVEAASPQTLIITDPGRPVVIAAGSDCTELDPASPGSGAQCAAPPGTVLALALGDADDRYLAEDGVTLPETIAGQDGDDRIVAGAGAGGLSGGAGDDTLDGGDGNDTLRGDDGADLLRGGSSADDLDGGPGDDRVDARTGGGHDRVTCAPDGGDDAIIRGRTETLQDCGSRPRASLRVPRQRIGAFFDDDGFDFRVRCSEPCAIEWEIVARDRSTRRRIHQRDRRLDKARPRTDADGFPRYLDAGANELHARPNGRATRRDIRAARRLRLRLVVTVIGRNSVERTLARNITLRR